MGVLGIGNWLPNQAIFKKRYRFLCEFPPQNGFQAIPACGVQIAARPQLTVEKNEIFFGNERAFIAAKGLWESINITFYDFNAGSSQDGSFKRVVDWVRSCYHFSSPISSGDMGDAAHNYKRQINVTMCDAHGTAMESWYLYGCFVESMNGGDLDYSSTDLAMLECTVSFDNADLTFGAPVDRSSLNDETQSKATWS